VPRIAALVALALALAGCTAAPDPDPTPGVPTCPEGLAAALEEHLADVPVGPQTPSAVRVIEFPDYAFAAPVLESFPGCRLGVERDLDGGVHVELLGITDGIDADAVAATLKAAGWAQPDASGHPEIWQTADHMTTASLAAGGVDPEPVLGFDGWGAFVGPGDVVYLGTIDL
jgi:hypothetical protein